MTEDELRGLKPGQQLHRHRPGSCELWIVSPAASEFSAGVFVQTVDCGPFAELLELRPDGVSDEFHRPEECPR